MNAILKTGICPGVLVPSSLELEKNSLYYYFYVSQEGFRLTLQRVQNSSFTRLYFTGHKREKYFLKTSLPIKFQKGYMLINV